MVPYTFHCLDSAIHSFDPSSAYLRHRRYANDDPHLSGPDCNYIGCGLATDCSAERGDGAPTMDLMDFDAGHEMEVNGEGSLGHEMEVNGEGSLGLGEPADPLACLLGLASTNQLCAIDATMHDRSGLVGT